MCGFGLFADDGATEDPSVALARALMMEEFRDDASDTAVDGDDGFRTNSQDVADIAAGLGFGDECAEGKLDGGSSGPRGGDGTAPSGGHPGDQFCPEAWSCPCCTVDNPPFTALCIMCSTTNPVLRGGEPTPPTGEHGDAKEPESAWVSLLVAAPFCG